MVTIPAGSFLMGSESPETFSEDGEAPVRTVHLDAFRIAPMCVTNVEFGVFVAETGYVTDAETFGWSFVFANLIHAAAIPDVMDGRVPEAPWWRGVLGASWRHPFGKGSELEGLEDHPVVHVSWQDAMAYTDWSGTRLPTEAEWERAARGGLDQAVYPWGDELHPNGSHRANIWQGTFPDLNTMDDGYTATAPVDSFPANGFGIYGPSGNVWEWTADWFSPTWHVPNREDTRQNPKGPRTGVMKTVRGGSYLCHASYCNRYRVSGRTSNTPDTSLGHTGFRVAADL